MHKKFELSKKKKCIYFLFPWETVGWQGPCNANINAKKVRREKQDVEEDSRTAHEGGDIYNQRKSHFPL